MPHDKIAVVDFGGQYAHLIATKIRRLHVLAEIRQPENSTDLFAEYKGIVLSGSPSLSAFGEDSVYNKSIYDLDVPILGFCFGHQEIAKHYGGEVIHGGREWGAADLHVVRDHPLFTGLARQEPVWMSHFDSVVSVGPEFEELGYTTLGESAAAGHRLAAIGSDRHRRYGFQFHPEVDDTLHGGEMLHRDRRYQARRHDQDAPQPRADHPGDAGGRPGRRASCRPVGSPAHDRGAHLPRRAAHQPLPVVDGTAAPGARRSAGRDDHARPSGAPAGDGRVRDGRPATVRYLRPRVAVSDGARSGGGGRVRPRDRDRSPDPVGARDDRHAGAIAGRARRFSRSTGWPVSRSTSPPSLPARSSGSSGNSCDNRHAYDAVRAWSRHRLAVGTPGGAF